MKRSLIFMAVLSFVLSGITSVFFSDFGKHDFIAYWSASRLLMSGQNPYDSDLMYRMQQANYPTLQQESGNAMNVWNPPWLLIFLIPWAALPFDLAAFFWMWFTIFIIGFNAYLCLLLSTSKVSERNIFITLMVSLLFAPTLNLIVIGQVSALVLSGFVMGIYLIKRGYLFLSGLFLVMITIKPHLSFLALIWIGWWIMRVRKFTVLCGVGVAILITTVTSLIFYPDYLKGYFALLSEFGVSNYYSSTIWSFLEATIGKPVFHWYGLLLLPLVFVLQPSDDLHDWFEKFCLILVVSLAFAPYGFSFDQILLLPVIIQILVWVKNKNISGATTLSSLGGIFAIYLGIVILIIKGNLFYFYFFWVPWGFLFVYGVAYYQIYRFNFSSARGSLRR